MLYCPCVIQIPLRYESDGRPVEPETLLKFFDVFNRQFGGYTPLGMTETPEGIPSGGLWHGQEDVSLRVEIAVHPDRTHEFEAIAKLIGKELEQKEMYIHIGPPSVKFLKVFDGDDDRDDVSTGEPESEGQIGKEEDSKGDPRRANGGGC